jgi:hypothetical protein
MVLVSPKKDIGPIPSLGVSRIRLQSRSRVELEDSSSMLEIEMIQSVTPDADSFE